MIHGHPHDPVPHLPGRAASGPRGGVEVPGPVFLLGPARSGTSLLYKLLCLHPEATWISNYVRRLPHVPELAVFNRLARRAPELRRSAWFSGGANAYVYGSPRPFTVRAFPGPVEGEPFFRACGIEETEQSVVDRQDQVRLLRRAVGRLQAVDGGRVLVNKRIANNRRVPLLHAAFPDARFVRLVRDGRAVALSLSRVDWWETDRVWWYGGTPGDWVREGGDPWELCARNWVEELHAIDAGLEAVPGDQVLSLRYEDFVAAPLATVSSLAAFAGLPESPPWREELARLSYPDRNESWSTSLPREALSTIERVQGELLAAHDYRSDQSPR